MKVIEVQPTPNPNAMKFVLELAVTDRPLSFFTAESASANPLAAQLFAIDGVVHVLLLGGFLTVNKSPEARWADITKAVKTVLDRQA